MVNDGTKYAVAQKRSAFKTNPNNPRVIKLIGIVRIVRTGLINALISPRTRPTARAVTHVVPPR